MAVAYKSAGAGGGTETSGASLDLACPATVDENDILIAHVSHTGITTAPSTPAGWTLLDGPRNIGQATAVGRSWVFGKLAVGDEDGDTIGFGTAGNSNGRWGRIYSFSGYESGTIAGLVPAASFTNVEGETSTISMPSVTTTVDGALAVALCAIDDNNAQASATGESGGNWAEAVAEFTNSGLGAQGVSCGIQTAAMATAGTISGGSFSQGSTDESSNIGFEIRPTSSYRAEVLSDDPAAYYRMGEASGQPQDSSGNGNHTTTTGGTPIYGETGALSGDTDDAILLDGSTEFFTAPDHASLDLGDVLSIEAWIKRGAAGVIVSKGTGAYQFDCEGASGALRFVKDGIAVIVTSTAAPAADTWAHVVATKNGATTKLYLDGEDVTGTVTDATLADAATALHIGRWASGGATFFTGGIDEVAIYPTALSAERVLAHYLAAVGGEEVPLEATVAGLGAVAADLTVARSLEASIAGTGALAAALAVDRPLAVTIAGASLVSPDLAVARPLEVAIVGQGAIAPDLTVDAIKLLEAAISGVGDVSAELARELPLAASITGEASLVPSLAAQLALASAVAGGGTVAAALAREVPLGVVVLGDGAIVADLRVTPVQLASLIAGLAGVSTDFTVSRPPTPADTDDPNYRTFLTIRSAG